MPSVKEGQRPLRFYRCQWGMCSSSPAAHLRVSECPWTRAHTHTHTTRHTHKCRHIRKPLCCELVATIGAGAGQAYYSYPQGVVSLVTGRHKYSSTSSPRVNGCPSGNNEMYRAACAWCRHTHRHARCMSTFAGRARSLMEMGRGETGRTRSRMRQPQVLCLSMFTLINRFLQRKKKTQTTHTHEVSTQILHSRAPTQDLCLVWSFTWNSEYAPRLALLFSTLFNPWVIFFFSLDRISVR